jgi:branched-chain amino acid transport system permease protein
MIGAYVSAVTYEAVHSFPLAFIAALLAVLAVGVVIEVVVFRQLYKRESLDQVLATFGLILFFNEMTRILWGSSALHAAVPEFLSGQVEILPGVPYPAYRLAIIVMGLLVAVLLSIVVTRTRTGMLIRAGASNRVMVGALGVNINVLYTLVFGLGAMLAGLSGFMAGPIFAVEIGMGENVVILAFVVIVIGGVGSIRGAFVAALLIGIIDTLGRAFLRPILATIMTKTSADNMGPALASMLIYILMAVVLIYRPQGFFPPRGR